MKALEPQLVRIFYNDNWDGNANGQFPDWQVNYASFVKVVRLAQGSYMRTTVMAESHYFARAVSQSALRRDKRLAHAQWELGMGEHRHYGRALVERARQILAAR